MNIMAKLTGIVRGKTPSAAPNPSDILVDLLCARIIADQKAIGYASVWKWQERWVEVFFRVAYFAFGEGRRFADTITEVRVKGERIRISEEAGGRLARALNEADRRARAKNAAQQKLDNELKACEAIAHVMGVGE